MTLALAIAVAVGGALGALLRYGAQLLWPARGSSIPFAVLLVNIVGSAVGGTFLALSTAALAGGISASAATSTATSTAASTAAAAAAGFGATPFIGAEIVLVIMTGFCGGLTTFSTFSVETVELVTSGAWRAAAANVALNMVLGIGAAGLAFAATHAIILLISGAVVG